MMAQPGKGNKKKKKEKRMTEEKAFHRMRLINYSKTRHMKHGQFSRQIVLSTDFIPSHHPTHSHARTHTCTNYLQLMNYVWAQQAMVEC